MYAPIARLNVSRNEKLNLSSEVYLPLIPSLVRYESLGVITLTIAVIAVRMSVLSLAANWYRPVW